MPRIESALTPALLALAASTACSEPPPQPATDAGRKQLIGEMYAVYRSSFADVPDITPEALVELTRNDPDVVVVDVREEGERAVSHIPGSIPKREFERERERYRGRKVVAYCTIGYRSGEYADALREDGWDALNLAGSILAWTHAGQPLEDADGPTRRVHVFGEQWNLAPAGYEAVW